MTTSPIASLDLSARREKGTQTGRWRRLVTCAAAGCAVSMTGAVVMAQAPAAAAAPASAPAVPTTGVPQRDTLIRMMRSITVEFKDNRLEDVMEFFRTSTGADLEIMWTDDQHPSGLEKEKQITFSARGTPALAVLEKILDRAVNPAGTAGGNTWQMTDTGTMQVGPKDRLNAFKRTEVYSVRDLLFEVPNYTSAPEFDLQQALQSRTGGGGGGQSPFRETGGGQNQLAGRPLDQRADDLKRVLVQLIEPEQWVDNGGDGATITWFQGSFIVNGPDYIHRGIDGYAYWPSSATVVTQDKGRRYVTLTGDNSIAKLGKIINVPVTAVAGGRLVSSNPSGPGGTKAPAKPGDAKPDEKKPDATKPGGPK